MPPQHREYEDSLRRAFVDRKADYIFVDSRRQRWLIECAEWGESQRWLDFREVEIDDQYTQWRWRLTPLGREHFGLVKKED